MALAVSVTSAFKQQHPAIRTGHRSGFRRSSWVVAASEDDDDDLTSQGHDDTSRAISGKLIAQTFTLQQSDEAYFGRSFNQKHIFHAVVTGIPEASFHASRKIKNKNRRGLVSSVDCRHI